MIGSLSSSPPSAGPTPALAVEATRHKTTRRSRATSSRRSTGSPCRAKACRRGEGSHPRGGWISLAATIGPGRPRFPKLFGRDDLPDRAAVFTRANKDLIAKAVPQTGSALPIDPVLQPKEAADGPLVRP